MMIRRTIISQTSNSSSSGSSRTVWSQRSSKKNEKMPIFDHFPRPGEIDPYVVINIPIRLLHSSFTRPCIINIVDMIYFQLMRRYVEICQFYLPHPNFVVCIYRIQNLSFLLTAFKICCLPHSKTALVLRDWQPPEQLQVLQPWLKYWRQ